MKKFIIIGKGKILSQEFKNKKDAEKYISDNKLTNHFAVNKNVTNNYIIEVI